MALPISNSFETGLADETGITTANSDDGTAGWRWDNVVIGSGATAVYDSARAAHGSLSARLSPNGAAGVMLRWDEGSSIETALTEMWGRVYIYRTANPVGAPQWFLHIEDTAIADGPVVRWKTDGKMDILDGGFNVVDTSTNNIPLNEWVRVEWHVVASLTVGSFEVKFFSGDSTTVIETLSATGINTAARCNYVDVGQYNAEATGSSIWIDDITVNATGYPGPAISLDTVLPDADVTTTGWSTAPLFSKVNDVSDATVIQATAV